MAVERKAMVFVIFQGSTQNLIRVVAHASIPSLVIMAILILLSILSWAIIISKYRRFRRVFRDSLDFLQSLPDLTNSRDGLRACRRHPDSPLAALFLAGHAELTRAEDQGEPDAPARLFALEHTLKKTALASLSSLEAGIPWLASIGTSSPFIGLFGTVVGIIMAFEGLSVQGQPSIETVAPAIAEALVATALGLFAAVPAYMGYNYFVARLRALSALIEQFTLDFLATATRHSSRYGIVRSPS